MIKSKIQKIKTWINFKNTKNIGPKKAFQLISTLGDPLNYVGVKNSKVDSLKFLSKNDKINLQKDRKPHDLNRIIKLCDLHSIDFITYLDENYPPLLKSIYEPPLFLFVKKSYNLEDLRRTIAIVGTRKASDYGLIQCSKIVQELVNSGITIVSGLAYGIDTQAHLTTVENKGKTIAVLGSGIDRIYPPSNRKLAERITENGAILSELIPGQKAEKWNFPRRNRIISGLSLGTLVVEGNKKSGSLLTAKFAVNQGREVFALPGNIDCNNSKGPNFLIQNGAKLVTSAEDILEEFDFAYQKDPQMHLFPELKDNEKEIYDLLLNNKNSLHFDQLILKTEKSVSELSTILLSLELKSIVKRNPGNKITALI